MSQAIDTHQVEAILLPDGKWYAVADKSFAIEAYELAEAGKTVVEGSTPHGGSAVGATWKDNMNKKFACPLTAILAVRFT
jgi:hypothetical protein